MQNLLVARAAIAVTFLVIANSGFTFASAAAVPAAADDDDNSYVYSLEDNDLVPDPDLGPVTSEAPESPSPSNPDIYYMRIHSNIRYRYSTTLVTCRAANNYLFSSKELGFQIVLPNSAYISKFIMDIDGKSYEAYVKEKEEARNIYNQARSQGRTGGLVEVSARDSNVFNLNITLKPSSKITFNLTYEEFLIRKLGRYEQIINVSPEQITKIPDFKVTVSIAESQNVSFLRVPKPERNLDLKLAMMRQAREADENPLDASDTRNIRVSRPSPRSAVIEWAPTRREMRTLESDGTNGKFVVQYDVARPNAGGEILLMNGYFVHFFAPHELYPLRQHICFALDVSGSMMGRKIEQLRNAMKFILDDLKPDDYFNIITFSSVVNGWNPSQATDAVDNGWDRRRASSRNSSTYRTPVMATEENLRKGHRFIDSLIASGGTDINSALLEALTLASTVKSGGRTPNEDALPSNVESAILFLTDGDPTTGVTALSQIFANVRQSNAASNASVPIYSLAFGDSADFDFIKKLALQNHGFGRKIYEASDADLQLKGFYKEISSPMLSNAKFRYTTNDTGISAIEQLTQVRFATVFDGSEVVVAGRLTSDAPSSSWSSVPIIVDIDGRGRNGSVSYGVNDVVEYDIGSGGNGANAGVLSPTVTPDNANKTRDAEDEFLERFWAYLTIKLLIEKDLQGNFVGNGIDDSVESEETDEEFSALLPVPTSAPDTEPPRERALKLALKYGFVTPLTSLVVVKPNDTDSTNTLTEAPAPGSTKSGSGHGHVRSPGWSTSSQSGSNRILTRYSYTSSMRARSPTSSPGVPGWSGPHAANIFRATPPDSIQEHASHDNLYSESSPADYTRINTWLSAAILSPTSAPARHDNIGYGGPRYSGGGGFRRNWQSPTTTARTTTTTYHTSTSTSTTTEPQTTTTAFSTISNWSRSRKLSLDDVNWLPNAMNYYEPLWINGTAYHLATRRKPVHMPRECTRPSHQPTNANSTTTTSIEHGICMHLRDCVLQEFVHDAKVYYDDYFCPLRSKRVSSHLYAGACC